METKFSLWKQIKEDSQKFGYHNRLTPHIYALSKSTNRYLSNLRADTVLDVGAGDKRYRSKVVCIRYISLDVSGKVEVTGDATVLPFKDKSIDMIICTQVLEHIKNPFAAVEEFSRVIKDKGIIFITVPTVMYLHEAPNDFFRYTKYGIESILNKNNFFVHKSETICSGFLVASELIFIGIYSIIYTLIKFYYFRRLLVNGISYLSYIVMKFDNSYVKNIFPGNILVVGINIKNIGTK